MLPRRTRRPAPAPLADFVVFRAAGRRFALPTRWVVAVAEIPELAPLAAPDRPEVLGLVGHRGRALPLVDLATCLDLEGGGEASGEHCVVVRHGERRAAFPVDELEGLDRIPADRGLPPNCETFDPARAIFDGGDGGTP